MDADVLLVEDEPRLRDMLLRAIREMGCRPTGAASAEQALRMMEQQPRPILIVDLNLPGAGGMDFVRTVRRRWPQSQAIILTGFGDLDAARQAIHLEVVDFLTKPCALGDLEIALGRAVQRLQRLTKTPEAMLQAQANEVGGGKGEDQPVPHPAAATSTPAALNFTPWEGNEALSIEEVERRTILAALQKHGQNRSAAAAELGISVRKLYYRLAQYQKQGHGDL